jgi:hypothetical protein
VRPQSDAEHQVTGPEDAGGAEQGPVREDDGVVIVAGPDAHRGRNHGLAISRVRTEDGRDHAATDDFRSMGGYLTPYPDRRL